MSKRGLQADGSIYTKDGILVYVGMWVSDTSGYYEVKSVNHNHVTLEEVELDESGDYNLTGNYRYLMGNEMGNMMYSD